MTIPGSDSSVWATVRDPASEDVNTQGQGANPQRGDGPTLSRRSLLLQASLLALYVVTVPGPAAALGLPRKSLPEATVQQMKRKAHRDVKAVRNQLNRDVPGALKQVVGTGLGPALDELVGLVGLGFIPFLLSNLGIPGLSAAGISSGLAEIGVTCAALLGFLSFLGGVVSPMVAGIVVLSSLPMLGGIVVREANKKIKSRGTKPVEKLEHAIQELKTIEARLKPPRQFKSEIAEIKTHIKELELERQKYKLT